MKLSQEHILALKISILLLIFFLTSIYILDFFQISGSRGGRKYIIVPLGIIFIYAMSYFLAKITIRPIELQNKKLSEYNHNLAHELKTPLSIMQSNLELLEIQYDKNLIISSREELFEMTKIIDNLLFLTQQDTKLEKNNIDIIGLIKKVSQKYTDTHLILKDNSNSIVYASEKLLTIVFENLLSNAQKYKTQESKINILYEKNSLSISNQIAIDEQLIIDNIFDLFYQGDNSRNISGYGLGLSIVKKICNIYKWDIQAKISQNIFFITIKFK